MANTTGKHLFSAALVALILGFDCLCGDCDRSFCPADEKCYISTLDACGCCQVCVRGLNETCGGSYGKFGVCQKSLDCIAMDDSVEEAQFVGICKDKSGNAECGSTVCPPIPYTCPWDSVYIPNSDRDTNSSCCPIEGTCHCAYAKCNDKCPEHYKKKVVSAADRSPGNCCELFECVPESSGDVCVDTESGLKYSNGEVWYRDPCTPCSCSFGTPQCHNNPCPRLSCSNPVKLEQECCPKCEDVGHCGAFKCDLDCGSGYVTDNSGCPICQCPPQTTCLLKECSLKCSNGLRTGPDGCPECECHECDDVMKHCTLSCGYGFEEDSRGCSLCKCKTDSNGSAMPPNGMICYENSIVYKEEETWYPNPCSSCTCYSGKSVCSITDCLPLSGCINPVTLPGTCCAVCKGTIDCEIESCPPLQCSETVIDPDKCCPICSSAVDNIVAETERGYLVVVAFSDSLDHFKDKETSFLKNLASGNDFSFTLKLLFSSDLKIFRTKSHGLSYGTIALVKAKSMKTDEMVLADQVVTQIDHDKVLVFEPDVIKIVTYEEYQSLLSMKVSSVRNSSKVSLGAMVGVGIATVIIAVLLVFYGTHRYMTLSYRRKFKKSFNRDQSADQLIHMVDNNKITINFTQKASDIKNPAPTTSAPPVQAAYRIGSPSGQDNASFLHYSPVNLSPESEEPS